jgi:hypothetical protein
LTPFRAQELSYRDKEKKSGKKGNLEKDLKEKDERGEARRGLDSKENYDDNTATFFSHIQ